MSGLSPQPRSYDHLTEGPAIYVDSFATIRREARLESLPPGAERLAARMVHGNGQVDLVDDLLVHPDLVSSARTALARAAPGLCDARMVAVGITAGRLPAANEVRCFLNDEWAPYALPLAGDARCRCSATGGDRGLPGGLDRRC